MPQEPLIDREFLERLERLTIRWQRSFAGVVGGHNISRFAGPGQEFLDHRHFHHGDDLRAVNWRAYLRFEKLFMKMFRVEPHTPVRLLLDTSQSMATGEIPKFEYARKLAAALCYVGLVRLDTICVQPFAESLSENCKCGGGRHRFAPVANYLTGLSPGGRTNYLRSAREFLSSYTHPGLAIVISDFLDDADCERPLQYLADFGHELMLVQLYSEEDRVPPWDGELELTDAETGTRFDLKFDSRARERYTAAFDAFSESIRRIAIRNGGRYVSVSTSMPVEDAIFGPLAKAGGLE